MGQHETFDSTYAKRMDSVNHSVGPAAFPESLLLRGGEPAKKYAPS